MAWDIATQTEPVDEKKEDEDVEVDEDDEEADEDEEDEEEESNDEDDDDQGCQMAIARFLDRMCLALWASRL